MLYLVVNEAIHHAAMCYRVCIVGYCELNQVNSYSIERGKGKILITTKMYTSIPVEIVCWLTDDILCVEHCYRSMFKS